MDDEPIVIGEKKGNSRVLRIAAVGAAVLLAFVFLPKLLGGGGDGTTVDPFPPVPTSTPPVVGGPAPAETFEAFTSKNPFTPLRDVGGPGGSDGSTDTTVPPIIDPGTIVFPDVGGDPGDPGFDDGSTPDDGSVDPDFPDDGSDPGSTPPPTSPPRQPDRVSLLEVFHDQNGAIVASVRVNDNTFQVGPRDEFAGAYRVLSLDGRERCGEFLFGDETFGLCEGDEVLK